MNFRRYSLVLQAGCLAGAAFTLPQLQSLAQDPATGLPEVRLYADPWKTSEPCPTCRVIPGAVMVERTGSADEPLTVYLAVDGTATADLDYQALPLAVEIPAGQTSIRLTVGPWDDLLAEGPEIVRVRAEPDRVGIHTFYTVSAFQGGAMVVIGDDEPDAPEARLDIVWPRDGDQVEADTVVPITALGVWTQGEVDQGVEFYAGEKLIGRTEPSPLARPLMACLPSAHTVAWTNPPPGDYILTARTQLGSGQKLDSPPVHLTVAPQPAGPVVGIRAVSPIAEESSFPLRRLALAGVLEIFRTGPTDYSLPVFVHYSGSSGPEDFFEPPPWLVSIPAGETSTEIRLVPVPDDKTEGIETLVAALSNCPPDTYPALGIPCYFFEIDPTQASATVYVREDGLTRATLAVTHPEEGAQFPMGEPIPIEAVGIDLGGYISRVAFFDGAEKIGESEIFFIRAPDPGTPIHHFFEWTHAAPGGHVITAQAILADGTDVRSAPVRITVEGAANQPPRVAIVRPAAGSEFPPFAGIEIEAQASDADGFVRKVAFFAGDRKIGEVGLDWGPRPEGSGVQTFTFVWRYPPPGAHVLTARAFDNLGDAGQSQPVPISVTLPETIPMVTVVALDAFAVDPGLEPVLALNTATFEIRRHGSLEEALVVRYLMEGRAENGVDYHYLAGRAENGVDYHYLDGRAEIPAGHRAVAVRVRPLPDDLDEGQETVVLRLIENSEVDPATGVAVSPYRLGHPSRAVALISDHPWVHRPGQARCAPAGDGTIHVCFAFETAGPCLIEASDDLRRWETLPDLEAGDGAVHYVEDETGNFRRRFYRLAH